MFRSGASAQGFEKVKEEERLPDGIAQQTEGESTFQREGSKGTRLSHGTIAV